MFDSDTVVNQMQGRHYSPPPHLELYEDHMEKWVSKGGCTYNSNTSTVLLNEQIKNVKTFQNSSNSAISTCPFMRENTVLFIGVVQRECRELIPCLS